jgi:hypothetical protein
MPEEPNAKTCNMNGDAHVFAAYTLTGREGVARLLPAARDCQPAART